MQGFLPSWPMQLNLALLFGVLLVAGMLGGEAARLARLPRVIGYLVVGFLIAPLASAMNIGPLLHEARIFVDIGLGLVLFELGRRLDLGWLRRDWSLAASGLLESVLAFAFVYAALTWLAFPPLMAAIAAAIAMSTSPAVVLLIAQDTRAEGQVTERALAMVALNSLLASVVVTILTASVHYEVRLDVDTAVLHPLYLFAGSIALGAVMARVARWLARWLGRSPELHLTLVAGLVLAAVGLAQMGKLSVILTLLAFGLLARGDRNRHELVNVDLGRASRLFYIVLFVITGASLPLTAFEAAGWAALAFVVARAAGKCLAVVAIAPIGGLTARQAAGLGAVLLPMSSLQLLLLHDFAQLYPDFGAELTAVVLAGLVVMEIAGPLATQWGLRFVGEAAPPAAPHPDRQGRARPTESTPPLDFRTSQALTFGVELELMVLNTRDYNLTRGGPDLLARLGKSKLPSEVKPEITESMIEVNSAVHTTYAGLRDELARTRDGIVEAAGRLNLAVAGGGSHPFHQWSERRIFPTERFMRVSTLYGYLAKQFTVFGQHIHIGVASGDDAIYLTHEMARYIPHFIALSASSPFYQGEDTSFETSRLHAVSAFPLAGHLPEVSTWEDFNRYFDEMAGYGIVGSMKDFYWDIRPKPEYGTMEIRIGDTPLTVTRAAQLAAYAQTLAADLLRNRRTDPLGPRYLVYGYNRFQACRFGFEAMLAEPATRSHVRLGDDLEATLARIAPIGDELGTAEALSAIREQARGQENDSRWLRERFQETRNLSDVVRLQAERWREDPPRAGK